MVQRPRGTRDFSPDQMERRRAVERKLRDICGRYGYREVATPTFEESELFTLRSGSTITDEMYVFQDKGGRELVLRPELTAPVMRFYASEMQNWPKPIKLFYHSNTFRYERPQAGRYREFWHFGVELIGPGGAMADAELLSLAISCMEGLGIKDSTVRIGHLDVLKSYLDSKLEGASVDMEPLMRLVDKKDIDGLRESLSGKLGGTDIDELVEIIGTTGNREEVFEKAQGMGLLADGSPERAPLKKLEGICDLLERFGHRDYLLDLGIARGLDYYSGMVFEIDVDTLGAEKQVCGGGRYSLAELFGAKPVETCGFAFGFDRLVLALETQGDVAGSGGIDAYVIWMGDQAREYAIEITQLLRDGGHEAMIDLMGRNVSKAMKYANQVGARKAIIVGESELAKGTVTVRDMKSGEQKEIRKEEIKKEL